MNGIFKYKFGITERLVPTTVFSDRLNDDFPSLLPEVSHSPILKRNIDFHNTVRGCILEIPISDGEQIYGLGLQMKSFNQNYKKKTLRVNSDPVADTGDSHAPVPMYVSNKGYAVFIDTLRYCTFYIATHTKKSNTITDLGNGPSDNTTDLYSVSGSKDKRYIIVEIPSAHGVGMIVFGGPTMLDAVKRYNCFSGGGYIPPLWGLGIWYRAYMDDNQESLIKKCNVMRQQNIPCDVIGLEPHWQTESYSCSYVFDKKYFPSVNNLLKFLKHNHFHLNLWEHIFVNPQSPIYKDLKKYSGNYLVWGGLVPDYSCSKAAEIFKFFHSKSFVKRGVSGFKLDECDNSDFIISPWSYPEVSQFPSGMDGEQMHCAMGNLYEQTVFDIFKEQNKRTLSASRSGGAFASSEPFVLYSDLYDHKDFIRSLVNSGFTGLSWTPEVRQAESLDDLYRRVETVIFSPMALINAWMVPNMPWEQWNEELNKKNILLDNKEEVTSNIKMLFELRMKFVPYLYTAYYKYMSEGIPPFRALVLDYPNDPNCFNCDLEYIMGDSILVAPLVAGENERNVYLPQGKWHDFFTGKIYVGQKTYRVSADSLCIPVFVKDATLLPLAKPYQFMNNKKKIEIIFKRFGDGKLSCNIYEDDGISFDYSKGIFNNIKAISENELSNTTVNREGNYEGELYCFNFK